MTQLMESMDYRQWLRQRAIEIKAEKAHFSYRYIAARLGVNAGFVAKVFNGQSHLALNKVEAVASLFELNEREKEYFAELVRFCRAKNAQDVETHFARLQSIRGAGFRTVADAEVEYFMDWYHMAMRTLLSISHFKGNNYRALGAALQPSISAAEAKKSVDLLAEMGLIAQDEDGVWKVQDVYVSTGEKWHAPAIKKYQRRVTEMSAAAQEELPRSQTDFSTLTLPFDSTLLEVIRERIRELRQDIIKLAKDCEQEDSVYQMNIQLYPVAKVKKALL
jgi:uncharacterized protein (TIGR02147 family)